MKVQDVTVYAGDGRFYVELTSDEGLRGYGECSPMHHSATAELIKTCIAPSVVGCSPFDHEKIEEQTFRRNYKIAGQLLAMAFSGVEMALWDLMGKALQQPVYNLIGGCYRQQVPVYASSSGRDRTPAEEAEWVSAAVERLGCRAAKIKVGPRMAVGHPVDLDRDEAVVRAVRAALGPDVALMIDANSSYRVDQAAELFWRIEDCDIHYYEEPCPYDDIEAYVRLAQILPVRLHVGEQDWNLYTFRDFISRGACHLYAVDPVKCGGIRSALRAATLCRAYGITYCPHNTARGLGLAATLHVVASQQVCDDYLEYRIAAGSKGEGHLVQPITVEDGMVEVPSGPGFGVDLDTNRLSRL